MTMHHLSSEEIAAYLDDECTDAEHRAAQSHLDTCAECRQIADDQLFIKQLMGSFAEPELPRSFVLPADTERTPTPLASPGTESPAEHAGGTLLRFEPVMKFLSIAAVIAFLVLGGAQLAGIGDDTGSDTSVELAETDAPMSALEEQEPALARGEVREQGETAAINAAPNTAQHVLVDTQSQATNEGLTPLEITTIGVGAVALVSIAGWILIHYRAGSTGDNS